MTKAASLACLPASLILIVLAVQPAEACSVSRSYMTRTASAFMTVQSGKPCTITFHTIGPVHDARVVKRPSHGSVDIPFVFKVTYKSRAGYTGSDMFKYEYTGFNSRNRRARSVVTVAVTVTP